MVRRTNQGGSVANYIVIGVILVAGLITAIYFLNQRSEQARKEQTIASNIKNLTTKTKASKTTVNKASVKSSSQSTNQSKRLPATGIELSIAELVSVYWLTTSLVAYVLSRRLSARSL